MGWRYREPGGEIFGPVDGAVLEGLLRQGKVTRGALVAREGTDGWAYPAEHAEFRDAVLAQQSGDAEAAEQARAASTLLPDTIRVIAYLSLLCGAGGVIRALMAEQLWLLPAAFSAVLATPFLLGFADIVLSLRRLCAK